MYYSTKNIDYDQQVSGTVISKKDLNLADTVEMQKLQDKIDRLESKLSGIRQLLDEGDANV